MLRAPLCLIIIFCLSISSSTLCADTITSKNGRSLEGLILSEDNEIIEMEVGIGTVKFNKSDVLRIQRGDFAESERVKQKWQREKEERQQKEIERQFEPKNVEFSGPEGQIFVDALIDGKVHARLLLDTGASLVLLSKRMADLLGVKLNDAERIAQIQVADGRKVNARFVKLGSLKVRESEARDVDAAILLEDIPDAQYGDGLLGMSFLKLFSFQVDYGRKKLVLEKLR